MPDTKALVMLDVSIHLMSMPIVPIVSSVASSLKRNLRSSCDTSALSHSHPRQLDLGVECASIVVILGDPTFVEVIVVAREVGTDLILPRWMLA